MSEKRRLSPQGLAGRKHLLRKVEVECAEPGCNKKLHVNRGNSGKPVRCEEHRKAALARRARARYKRREQEASDNRLDQLRSFKSHIKCRNEFCENIVEVDGLTARNPKGVYCNECRYEAKQISDRNYYASRGKELRQKRQSDQAA